MRSTMQILLAAFLITATCVTAISVLAQGRPPLRVHKVNKTQPIKLVPANQQPPAESRVTIREEDGFRVITCNDIPRHNVGQFPNPGNPHTIAEQQWKIRLPLHPTQQKKATSLHQSSGRGPPNMPFGLGINGVLFEPGTAEFWMGNRKADWNYEALGGAIRLGLDANHAHVQPGGIYHYHGAPIGLLNELHIHADEHSPIIGWAADGFPIYYLHGYENPEQKDSAIKELTSSYRLRQGERPDGTSGPGGDYDGTFVQDYEFIKGEGDLDECNGRFCITPEFPDGTYAYFFTKEWPVIPRAFRGKPVNLREARPSDRQRRR